LNLFRHLLNFNIYETFYLDFVYAEGWPFDPVEVLRQVVPLGVVLHSSSASDLRREDPVVNQRMEAGFLFAWHLVVVLGNGVEAAHKKASGHPEVPRVTSESSTWCRKKSNFRQKSKNFFFSFLNVNKSQAREINQGKQEREPLGFISKVFKPKDKFINTFESVKDS
jgi:hypothetical protein